MEEMIKQLITEFKEFKTEMLEFKTEMQEFKSEMQEFKTEMQEFKHEQLKFNGEVKGELDKLSTQMDNLAELQQNDVVNVLQRMDDGLSEVRSEVRYIAREQKNQHRVIELLSSRSIQLEADIQANLGSA